MGISCTKTELESLIYFWKSIGYIIGIKDEYNLCNGTIDQVTKLCQIILENDIKHSILNPELKQSMEMSKGIVCSVKTYVRFMTYQSLSKYLFKLIEIEVGPDEPDGPKMTFYAWICYWLLWITMNYTAHLSMLRVIFNSMLRLSLVLTRWRASSIENYLNNKYTVVLTEETVIYGEK